MKEMKRTETTRAIAITDIQCATICEVINGEIWPLNELTDNSPKRVVLWEKDYEELKEKAWKYDQLCK